MYDILWAVFAVAFVLSLVTTPLAIKIAPKIGAMDVPKDGRIRNRAEAHDLGGPEAPEDLHAHGRRGLCPCQT